MKFFETSETDYTVNTRHLSRVGGRLKAEIDEELKARPEFETSLEVIYCPIIMCDEIRGFYPARSRVKKARGIVSIAPQIDYKSYQAADLEGKYIIYLEALDRELLRMKPRIEKHYLIREFEDILATLLERARK